MSASTLIDPRSLPQDLCRHYAEPDWARELRSKALAAYLDFPLPSRVQHLWRYSDPLHFAPPPEIFGAFAGRLGAAASEVDRRASGNAISEHPVSRDLQERVSANEIAGVALHDGTDTPTISLSVEAQKAGVRVLDLHAALREVPDLVKAGLGKLVKSDVAANGAGKFEALNLGLWTSGTVVHVPRNVRLEAPVHVWLNAKSSQDASPLLATRLFVVVEEGAELTLIDECEGGTDGLLLNSAVEIFARDAARVRYVSVQRLGRGVRYHVAQRASVARDANVFSAIASLGAGVTKSDFGSILEGSGANVELFGFLYGEEGQRFDHHTLHDHRAGHTYSNLDFKVVLTDRAHSAYTGLIRIEADAPGSEAYQENRNLLLDERAKAESIPELEILTDEVKCSHGATVGTLDPNHLFYLMCRGLERTEAIRLIVAGFVEPTLSRLPANLQERLRGHVEEKIQQL